MNNFEEANSLRSAITSVSAQTYTIRMIELGIVAITIIVVVAVLVKVIKGKK